MSNDPYARHERHRERQREAARRRAARRRERRRALDFGVDARRRAAMRRVIAETFEHDPPPADSPRYLRLAILGMSLRELAKRADVAHATVDRAERGFEAGDPDAVRGPNLRKIAAALERELGRRVKIDAVRAPRDDG